MTKQELIAEAFKAMENAYAPYSNYHVGACILTTDGNLFYGANIENASFGATNCAERSAVFAAYSRGYRKDTIEGLAIVSDGDRIAAPCGICRQVMTEFCDPHSFEIVLARSPEDTRTYTLAELLPLWFTEKDMKVK